MKVFKKQSNGLNFILIVKESKEKNINRDTH